MDKFEIFQYLLRIPIVLLSLSVHEVAHGYIAYKLGDPTARNLGRLSLNPLKHLDPIGAICMVLFRFGWAKPVPINTRYFKKPRRDMALSALAGPVSNLLMAFVAYVISIYLSYFSSAGGHFYLTSFLGTPFIATTTGKILYIVYLFFANFFLLNASLAVFNLLPVPPLDGSRILYVFLPDKLYFGVMKYERIIEFALFGALWLGLLDGVLQFVFNLFIEAFNFIVGFLPLL